MEDGRSGKYYGNVHLNNSDNIFVYGTLPKPHEARRTQTAYLYPYERLHHCDVTWQPRDVNQHRNDVDRRFLQSSRGQKNSIHFPIEAVTSSHYGTTGRMMTSYRNAQFGLISGFSRRYRSLERPITTEIHNQHYETEPLFL